MAEKSGLEACIAPRGQYDDSETWLYANVIDARTENGLRYITIYEEESPTGGLTSQLLLDNYFILKLTWSPAADMSVVDSDYTIAPEDQNDAFETMQQVLNDEQGFQLLESAPQASAETAPMSLAASHPFGPKRVEVILSPIGMPKEERRVVVHNALPPAVRFMNSSVQGRVWQGQSGRLSATVEFFNSYSHNIKGITVFGGGASSSVTTFYSLSNKEQEAGWKRLDTEFKKLKPSELVVVKNWRPLGTSATVGDDVDDYETTHYYHRTPHRYLPPVKQTAFYRVSGDELGVSICQERQASKPRTLAELKELEKLLPKEKAVSAAISKPAESKTSSSQTPFCDCGSPVCEDCAMGRVLHGFHRLH